jgi:Mce-associated membrane protein
LRRITGPLWAIPLALVIVAAGFAGWTGISWYSAAHAAALSQGKVRDQALAAGEQAVQNFNTLNYRDVNAGLNLWEQSSTGTLHAQIEADRAQFAKQIQRARTVTTAKILDAALTSLDARAGTATIIVAIQITVTPAHGAPVVKQSRLEGQLTRTATGWKLSALGQVPVGATASSGG